MTKEKENLQFRIFYVIFGIGVSLIIAFASKKVKMSLKKIFNNFRKGKVLNEK